MEVLLFWSTDTFHYLVAIRDASCCTEQLTYCLVYFCLLWLLANRNLNHGFLNPNILLILRKKSRFGCCKPGLGCAVEPELYDSQFCFRCSSHRLTEGTSRIIWPNLSWVKHGLDKTAQHSFHLKVLSVEESTTSLGRLLSL